MRKKKKKIGGVWLAGDFKVHVAAAASLIFGVPIVEARTFFFFFSPHPVISVCLIDSGWVHLYQHTASLVFVLFDVRGLDPLSAHRGVRPAYHAHARTGLRGLLT